MKLFLNVIFYKSFRFLERFSKGDREHCAFNAMVFTLLILFLNVLTIFFLFKRIILFQITSFGLSSIAIIILLTIFCLCYGYFMRNNRYDIIINNISKSSIIGHNWTFIVLFYIIISLIVLFCMLAYFVKHPTHTLMI